jgi:hypothetical protein
VTVQSEPVNDGVSTAPSKRIASAYPQYVKTIDGFLVITEAGLTPSGASARRSTTSPRTRGEDVTLGYGVIGEYCTFE